MSDSVLRAIADDGAFRVIVAQTTSTVREAIAAQGTTGAAARTFAELLTGAILVRETMAPQLRVQAILKSGNREAGTVVADSHPDGSARGLVNLRAAQIEGLLGEGALLQVMRTMPGGSMQQGIVEVPAPGGISAALMAYMQSSEQVESVVAVGTLGDEGGVVRAGGFIVQLLPEANEGALEAMVARLSALPDIDAPLRSSLAEPRRLVAELLTDMPYTLLEESPLRFDCRCSLERVLGSLATLDRAEIADMLAEQRVFEITCDYCGKIYPVGPDALARILELN
jgi:molecular chaperone Hsp33